jgi:hypothetical protein
MKTLTLGNLEILAKGERGLADNDIFSRMEADLFLASLPTGGGDDWRFPTWNEWHYLLDLFSLSVLREEIISDNPQVFIWVKWEGLNRDLDPYKDDIWDFNKYWWPKRNAHNLAMEPFNRTLEPDTCPWLDMTDLEESDKMFFILPVRTKI